MKIKKVRPLLNHILTTADVYTTQQSTGNVVADDDKYGGEFKEYQKVVAVGPNVQTVKPGDLVVLNPRAYVTPRHKAKEDSLTGLMTGDEVEMVVNFPIVYIDDTPHLFLYDRDIEFVIEEFEEDSDIKEEETNLIA